MNIDRRGFLLVVSATAFALAAKPVAALADSPTIASNSDGRTFFVSPSGSDLNDGRTSTTAFKTIKRAFGSVSGGYTIQLMPGNYQLSDLPPLNGLAG